MPRRGAPFAGPDAGSFDARFWHGRCALTCAHCLAVGELYDTGTQHRWLLGGIYLCWSCGRAFISLAELPPVAFRSGRPGARIENPYVSAMLGLAF